MDYIGEDEYVNITEVIHNCTLGRMSVTCDLKTYIDYTILFLIGLNAIGIGGHVDGERMFLLLTRPFLVSMAMVLRFILVPAIGLGITELFKLPPVVGMSTLAIIIAPHEGISTLFIMLLDGDLTISMAIVGANNFSTSAFLPLWAMLYEYHLYGSPGVINLPMQEIFTVFGYICGAASIGLLIRKKCDKCYDKYWEYLPTFTILTTAFIITTQIFMHINAFPYISLKIIATAFVTASSGFLIGAIAGYILQQSQEVTIILCIETGVRTTYITSILSSVSFMGTDLHRANSVPFLVSTLSVIPVFITVLVVRVTKTKSMFKKYFKEQARKQTVATVEEPLCSKSVNKPDC